MASPQKENGYTEISNEILESLAKIRIPGEARQMLDVVIRKTYGFNKKHDSIATSQFVKLTGLPRYAIHRARIKLVKMNLITVTKKADSQILTYSYQKDYDKWELSPKKVTVTKKATHCNQKSNALYPKKVTNCNPKSGTQKKERNYTKETITKETVKGVKNLTPLQEVVEYFIKKRNIKLESKEAVSEYFKRHGKSASSLLKLTGGSEKAISEINRVSGELDSKELNWTLDTVCKWVGNEFKNDTNKDSVLLEKLRKAR